MVSTHEAVSIKVWYVHKIWKESRFGASRLFKEGFSIVQAGKYSPPTFNKDSLPLQTRPSRQTR